MRWIRLDVSWDDSPWLFDLPAESQLAWIKLLCHVKRDGSGGSCKAMAPEVAARRWGISVTGVTALLGVAMADGALLAENGEWTVCNWAKYQDNDTTRAERQRRFRERSQVQNVTESNGVTGVTDGVTCRVTETETETVNTDPKGSCPAIIESSEIVVATSTPDQSSNWLDAACAQVTEHLNRVCGKRYDPKKPHKNLRARLKEFRVPERDTGLRVCRLVIEHKFAEWGKDPRMRGFLRPETLFAEGHWQSYTLSAIEWDEAGRPSLDRTQPKRGGRQTPEDILALAGGAA